MIDEQGLTLLGASFGNPENESTVQMALLPDEPKVGSRNGPTWF